MNQTPQSQPQGGRPGQMTAVMRAMQQATGPKVLRIGLVQSGKVIEERVIKTRTHVTIGPSEKSMFVLPTKAVPPNFKLFELVGNDYVVNFIDGMTGRVALKTGISDLAALRGQAKRVQQGSVQAYQIGLSEDARGKVVIGETTFLFQFVAQPPIQPKPQLPLSVKSGVDIDWTTTIIAAFSFLVHFGAIGLIWSDLFDPPLDVKISADMVQKVAALNVQPEVTQKDDADTDATAAATTQAPAEAQKSTPKAQSQAANTGGAKAAPGAAQPRMNDTQAAQLSNQMDELNTAMLQAIGSNGESTNSVLNNDTQLGDLGDSSKRDIGVGGSTGGLHMGGVGFKGRPGQVGSTGLNQTGDTGSGDKQTDAGTAVAKAPPKAGASVGGAAVSGGTVANASAVVGRLAGAFRSCYQRGLNDNPDMSGTVHLTIKVGPNGEVQSASASPSGTISGAVASCVGSRAQGATFAPPDGGSATLSVPVTFQPQK